MNEISVMLIFKVTINNFTKTDLTELITMIYRYIVYLLKSYLRIVYSTPKNYNIFKQNKLRKILKYII